MSDDLTQAQRHKNMSHIRSSSTAPELTVRKYLFSQGFRYRINDRRYPGHPDIVLPKYHTIIFVNGCFWHQHPGCKYAVVPKSNSDYWIPKLQRNVERDKENYSQLMKMGWNVEIVWECELKTEEKCKQTLSRLTENLRKI